MDILFLSHSFWGSDFRVGSHHLSRNMARTGHRVFYVSMPVTPFHLFRYKLSDYRIKTSGKLTEIEKGLHQFIPRSVFPAGRFFSRGKDISLASLDLRSTASRLGIETFDLVFMDEPRLYGMLSKLNYKKLIYRPTDLKTGIDYRQFFKLENQITRICDGVIATSAPVMESLEKFFDIQIPRYVQENGVDLEHFSMVLDTAEEIASVRGTKCIYVGAFDERFDFDGIEQLVKRAPDINFFFVGPDRSARIRNLGLKNCRYLGVVPFDELPKYLHSCDVAIMPFSSNASNDGRSPMKLYEFLAAGLPVVARRTKELTRRSLEHVFLYDDMEEALGHIKAAAKQKRASHVPEEMDWRSISERMIRFGAEL
jgi:glycosyltransferase involved in cell wall biosynthesis